MTDPAPHDLHLRLRPRGAGRHLAAAFLGVWLCGWAAGEGFVLWILVRGAVALVTGTPLDADGDPLAAGPSLGVGLFLTVWLTFWTVGGVAAVRALLQSVWADDQLAVRGRRLAVRRTLGPFRSMKVYEADAIRRIDTVPSRDVLTLWTTSGAHELSRLGTSSERRDAARRLTEALDIREDGEPDLAALPDGWEESVTRDGERVLVTSPRRRRLQALVAAVVSCVLVGLGLVIRWESAPHHSPNLAVTVVVLGLGGLCAYGALWFARGRHEWVLGERRLWLQRRFGRRCTTLFEARALHLERSRDSDGDSWFRLHALVAEGATARADRRRILGTLHDASEPRALGAWLAQACRVPFADESEDDTPPVDLAELKARLEQSGPLGRWLARRIPASD